MTDVEKFREEAKSAIQAAIDDERENDRKCDEKCCDSRFGGAVHDVTIEGLEKALDILAALPSPVRNEPTNAELVERADTAIRRDVERARAECGKRQVSKDPE
jgi:hypothetical protein